MGIEKILFKSEEKKSAADIANTLRLIADKIDSGGMTLKQGETNVEIEFPGAMKFELKVEEEQGRHQLKKSFEVELEWVPGEEESSRGADIL